MPASKRGPHVASGRFHLHLDSRFPTPARTNT